MEQCNIVFIGGGNMAGSIIGGLLQGDCPATNIYICDPDQTKLDAFQQRYGVNTSTYNDQFVGLADVLVLAVKPQMMHQVAGGLASKIRHNTLLVSIAAGIREKDIGRWLNEGHAIVRCMPNTPSLVQTGASALYANNQVSDTQRDLAESLMRTVGIVVWLEHEAQMDAVTAVSGSGPAYFFLVMEAMQKSAEQLGLSPGMSRLLITQTALGAAKMAMESEEGMGELRHRVTSPGGTTEQGIRALQAGALEETFDQALQAACRRSKELAKMLGDA